MNFKIIKATTLGFVLSISNIVNAGIITFDNPTITSGAQSYSADSDGDSIIDVIFTITPNQSIGLQSQGPGANQLYTDGIGMGWDISDTLKVDFIHGAINNLSFGMIFGNFINIGGIDEVTFSIFDNTNNILDSVTQIADYTFLDNGNQSDFPETFFDLSFTGVASYATFSSFNGPSADFFIDNLSGTFGSSERSTVPEPSTLAVLVLGLLGFNSRRFKK